MAGHSVEEMKKHVRVYIAVSVALAALTVLTVWASYLKVSPVMHIVIALAIASVKGGLVMAYFMHLISEKKLIRSVLVLTAFLFLFMIVFTYLGERTRSPVGDPYFDVHPTYTPGAAHH